MSDRVIDAFIEAGAMGAVLAATCLVLLTLEWIVKLLKKWEVL